MFARPSGGEKTALVQVSVGGSADPAVIEEFQLLASAAGAEILFLENFNRNDIEPRYYIGKGQAEALAERVKALGAELVIVNAPLSPSQERNLERLCEARVLDRSGLVLDIFAQRARSHEGKLQVELAQLKHLSTRLVRGWTHLERQKGGIGLRGPGETQLETDRRLLGARIKQLQARLSRVEKQRAQVRQSRSDLPTVALAGYTNSGKSTLFNALTRAEVLAKDQLFATLDPTWRRLSPDDGQTILLADTVGFVSQLPHELVEAFKSTLEETVYAQLILQVIDIADNDRLDREAVVEEVLTDIGAAAIPTIRVYNKIDKTGAEPAVQYDEHGQVSRVFLSALTGAGVELLRTAIVDFFRRDEQRGWLCIEAGLEGLRSALYRERFVQAERSDAAGRLWLQLRLPAKRFQQLTAGQARPLTLHDSPPEDE